MNLKVKSDFDKAQSVAINFINYRLRSEQELRSRLIKNFDAQIVDSVIEKMYDFGFLNDSRFAKVFTESHVISRPKSKSYIKRELIKKGIDKELADSAVKNINDNAICLKLAIKKSSKLSNLPWSDFQKKMFGFLSRKGFNYSISNSATKEAWNILKSET